MASLGMIAAMIPKTLLLRASKAAGSGMLGLAVLSFVADQSGSKTGEAVVHVTETDVDLTIGGNSYRISTRRDPPIVCLLPAGQHELIMKRGSRILQKEWFTLEGGDSVVLTAWDPERFQEPSAQEPKRLPTY